MLKANKNVKKYGICAVLGMIRVRDSDPKGGAVAP